MSLRIKTLLVIGVFWIIAIFTMYYISSRILLSGFKHLEIDAAQQNTARALEVVDGKVDQLMTLVTDWAWWDDTYRYIDQAGKEYEKANFGIDTWLTIHVDMVAFLNAEGQAIFSTGVDLAQGKLIAPPAGFTDFLSKLKRFNLCSNLEDGVKGLVLLPEGPALISARHILKSDKKGPSHGIVIFGQSIDKTLLDQIANIVHFPLKMFRYDDPENFLSLAEKQLVEQSPEPVLVEMMADDRAAGFALLRDIFGRPALVLRLDMPRPIHAVARQTLHTRLISTIVLGIIFGSLVLLLLRQMVVQPLIHLSEHVVSIATSGNTSERIDVTGRDELAQLGLTINDMLGNLHRTELDLRKANTALRTVSECDQALVRATSEMSLLKEICNVIVREGDYRMVWIGYAEDDENRSIKPVAMTGFEEGYLQSIRISWADNEYGRGPTGTAIRTGQTVSCDNILTDPKFELWQEEATKRGYASSIALPLQCEGKVIGALNLYAQEPDAFVGQRRTLLEELAADVSYGITSIRARIAQQQAEESLRQSELRYRTLVESSFDAIFLESLEGEILDCNEPACRMYGYTREELLQLHVRDLVPEDIARKLSEIMETHSKGGSRTFIETSNRRKDGQFFPVEVSLRGILRGDEKLVIAAVHDLSERKRAEQQILAAEHRYRELVEKIPAIAYIFEFDGIQRTTYISPQIETLLGFTPEEWLADPELWIRQIHPMDRERVVQSVRECDAGGKSFVLDYRVLNRQNGVVWIRNRATYVLNESGKPARLHGVMHDITSQKEAEEALHKSELQLQRSQKLEAIGRLAGGVAHDFNNLLTSIMGFARLIYDSVPEGHSIKDDAQEIINSGERAAHLTRQLLALGRKQMTQMRHIDLNNVVIQTEKLLRRTLGEDIELVTRLGDDLGTILADAGQIEQVILNLALNGRDAMPKGGKLIIETSVHQLSMLESDHMVVASGTYVRLSVRDTGQGMSEEVRSHLFEPFFTTKETGQGSGLGLSTVYGIIQQCHGYIHVDSEIGCGTEFKIHFPRYDMTPDEIVEENLLTLPHGTETILIVEDEATVRHLTERLLKSLGYKVVAAENSGNALLIIERLQEPIHLVMTDIVMPQVSGPEMVDRLRQIRTDFKVLFTTGFTEDTVVQHGALTKDSSVILKPYTRESLARKVREILDS